MKTCRGCSRELKSQQVKYCSTICQKDVEYRTYITAWKKGLLTGDRGVHAKNLSAHVIRYVFEKFDNKCILCGWATSHPVTGRPPLEIDHIDGNADNNKEDNLRLLCPNCHSLTLNYKNYNKGRGRLWRKQKYMLQ